MDNKCKYLYELGYSEKYINDYLKKWNNDIISFLDEHSDSVLENIQYISSYFEPEILLKFPIFYPHTFVLKPSIFKERFEMLKNEFPQDFVDIVEKQFWGYEGFDSMYIKKNVVVDDIYYIPYMESMCRDNQQVHKAIESIKNPCRRIYKFLIMLEQDFGINVLPEDIEDMLLDLEVSKWEIEHNAKYLVEKGLAVETVKDILCHCPFIMMGSVNELEKTLVKTFGDNYVDTINKMLIDEFWVEKLYEIV